MLNVDLVGGMRQLPSGVRERRIPPLGGSCGGGWPQARALLKPATVILRAAALAGAAALFSAA